MKLIKPSYKIEYYTPIQLIEKAGRTAYKTEDEITEHSYAKFINMIIKRGHGSVIEHGLLSVRFIIDRGISHELVRHRLASFTQESTRYCNYSKDKFDNQITYVIPYWLDLDEGKFDHHSINDHCSPRGIWLYSMLNIEANYLDLLQKKWSPQKARAILPNSLKTEIVVTANYREWQHIFILRTDETAHPQMREVMIPLLQEVKEIIPVVFDKIPSNYNMKEVLK